MPDDTAEVLAAFGISCPPAGLRPLGAAGGFSGARFWKIAERTGTLCLRRWPAEHPTPEQLEFIHALLRHVAQAGFRLVPLPRSTLHGTTFVRHDGHLWELTAWMPGEADFHRSPTPRRLVAALHALAQFHRAAADFPGASGRAVSPGIVHRLELLDRWRAGGLDRLADAITPNLWPELYERAGRLVMGFRRLAESIRSSLAPAATRPIALQPCMRDIWHDHVLFQGDAVTGLVDFGSVASDTVACDVARLLGSLVGDTPDLWKLGLESYRQIRPLGDVELELVRCFDRSTVLMAGLNWLQWIYVDQRRFDDPRAVVQRIDEILLRLDRALGPVERQGGRAEENSR